MRNQDGAGGISAAYRATILALVLRDMRVLRREFGSFLVRTAVNPLLFVFVFTYVFPRIGQGFSGKSTFATVLLPGLMAVAVMFQGIAAIALPLSVEIGATREIEDRVMAPIPIHFIAATKVGFSGLQSVLAAVVVFPLIYFLPAGPVHVRVTSWPLLLAVLVLGGLSSGSLGLAAGTVVKPKHISLLFSVIIVPLTFLGCVYYPWALLRHIRWLQLVVLANPLVYISEGLRAALTPELPHMPLWGILGALSLSILTMGTVGIRSFVQCLVR